MIKKLINFTLLLVIFAAPIVQAGDQDLKIEQLAQVQKAIKQIQHIKPLSAEQVCALQKEYENINIGLADMASRSEIFYAFDAFSAGALWPFSLHKLKISLEGIMNTGVQMPFSQASLYRNMFLYLAGAVVSTCLVIKAFKKLQEYKNKNNQQSQTINQ